MAYGLITTGSLLKGFFEKESVGTSSLEKRCVSDVVKKGKTVSQAYAICRSSLQKSGRIEKGGMELTKLGKTISKVKSRKSDHAAKLKSWKKAIVKARKSR
jgi:hypothetical protein